MTPPYSEATTMQYTATKAHIGSVGAGLGGAIALAIVRQWPELEVWGDVLMIALPAGLGWLGTYFPTNKPK